MVVSKKIQERVVELANQGHQGMVKTKRLIRTIGVDTGDRCTCRKEGEETHGLSSQHTSTGIIDGTDENVKATGGTMAGDHLLVAIEEYSRFPEMEITRSTSTYSTIQCRISYPDKIFCTHDIPEVMKLDKEPPF